MKRHLLGLATLCLLGVATAQTAVPAYITAAIADSARPEADKANDPVRKPAELIAFAGVKPGDRVADILPGGGYFTRLFSKAVGPKGHVYAVLPESVSTKAPPQKLQPIRTLAADPAYRDNTSVEVRPYGSLDVGAPLDVVWTSQNYHDIYGAVTVFGVDGTPGPDSAAKLDAAVFKALKPGGVFIVVDHTAKAGATAEDARTLHRIDPAVVIEQAKAAGFVLEGRSAVLENPQDAHDQSVFTPDIKGHTDKFALKFRKPAGH